MENPAALKVLLIDDDSSVLGALSHYLKYDYNVVPAHNVQGAVAAMSGAPYDIALIDLHLHEMDGFELRDVLLHLQPTLRVVLMTGGATPAEQKRLDLVEWINKPFLLSELHDLLASPRK